MKYIAAFTIALFVSITLATADPLLGTWQTTKRDDGRYGHVAFSRCGAAICGVLVQSFDQAGKQIKTPIDGRKIVWDMKAGANKTYGGGKGWSPEANKTYTGKLSIKGNQLMVKGCVLAICRTGGVWSRVSG